MKRPSLSDLAPRIPPKPGGGRQRAALLLARKGAADTKVYANLPPPVISRQVRRRAALKARKAFLGSQRREAIRTRRQKPSIAREARV